MMDSGGWSSMMGNWGGLWGLGALGALLLLVNFVAVLWALYRVMNQKKTDAGIRIGWVVIVLALQIIGVLLYLLVEKRDEE